MSAINHLCVLIHGLWGKPAHLDYLRDCLKAEYRDRGLEVFVPESNSNYYTYDGIEVGAERVCHEVENRVEELAQAGARITKISIVGYSLGGLIARFLVGLLHQNGTFDSIQPVNFTTFATPHIGVKTPSKGYISRLFNLIGSATLSTTGQQMFLVDNFRGTGRQLLDVLADPSSIFLKGLRRFHKRTLYANTVNDRSVPFYTAYFSRTNPYVDLDAVDVHPLREGDTDNPVLLDPEQPFTKRDKPRAPEPSQSFLSPRTRVALPFYAFAFTVMPVLFPLILLNSGLQNVRSIRRMRLHESGSSIDISRYRSQGLLEEAQAMQDRVIERLATESIARTGEDYLPTPPPETTEAKTPPPAEISPSSLSSKAEATRTREDASGFPTLALTKEQFAMIDHLDDVGFTKYPAHIVDVHHTHAAIVVRVLKDQFHEGKVVVKHWVEDFEV